MLQNSVERRRLIDKNKMYPKNESLKYDIAMSTLVVYAVQTPPPLIHRSPRSPFSQDPGEGIVRLTANSRFCLVGLRLRFSAKNRQTRRSGIISAYLYSE